MDIKTHLKNLNIDRIPTRVKPILAIIFLILFVAIATVGGINLYFKDRIFPGVRVLNINLGGKKIDQAIFLLSDNISLPEKIEFVHNQKSFELSLEGVFLAYDFDKTANHAYQVYRKQGWLENYLGRIMSPFKTHAIKPSFSFDTNKFDEYLRVVSEHVLSEPTYPSVTIEGGAVSVDKGRAGEILDKKSLLSEFEKRISTAEFSAINLPLKVTDPSLTDEEAEIFKKRAESLVAKTFQLKNDYDNFYYNDQTIVSFLDYHKLYDVQKIAGFIETEITPEVERAPQNAVLHFENERVTEFVPAKDGLSIEKDALINEIIINLSVLENSEDKSFSIDIPVRRSSPEITLNEVNDLGIRELLGRGSSKFRGSISGRVHNISLAASKFDGLLVPPGETFSFNNALGDVSSFTGYKQAYIIKDGKTVLGDGGGVCQVSTTLFRAMLDAGLPITERRAHSYRVSYYEQDSSPGLDATIYAPTTDLKFINDTPGHLLIQTQFDAVNYSLVFEIYGTSDGRVAKVSKPVITSSIAPPEDLYIDDPSLPEGTIRQIDYKAWGARAVFDYTVVRNGEKIIEKTYVSNYQPWRAVFLRGVGPAD